MTFSVCLFCETVQCKMRHSDSLCPVRVIRVYVWSLNCFDYSPFAGPTWILDPGLIDSTLTHLIIKNPAFSIILIPHIWWLFIFIKNISYSFLIIHSHMKIFFTQIFLKKFLLYNHIFFKKLLFKDSLFTKKKWRVSIGLIITFKRQQLSMPFYFLKNCT